MLDNNLADVMNKNITAEEAAKRIETGWNKVTNEIGREHQISVWRKGVESGILIFRWQAAISAQGHRYTQRRARKLRHHYHKIFCCKSADYGRNRYETMTVPTYRYRPVRRCGPGKRPPFTHFRG